MDYGNSPYCFSPTPSRSEPSQTCLQFVHVVSEVSAESKEAVSCRVQESLVAVPECFNVCVTKG